MVPPPWQLLLIMIVLSCFDAFSGFVGGIVFAVGSVLTAPHAMGLSDYRMLAGVLVGLIAPSLLATAFRSIRKPHATDMKSWWERVVDLAVAPFIAGWSASSVIGSLPALAGVTLAVANHVADFGFFIAIAIAARVLLEEFASQYFPERLDAINPDEIPEPPKLQKLIVLFIKYGIWIFIATALLGNNWQVWLGSALFIFPSILGWFQDRFPNSALLWKLIPSGIPGLAFSLIIASLTSAVASMIWGQSPQFAQWSFAILPLPMMALTIISAFGRHGADDDDEKVTKSNKWIYRIGGVIMLIVTLRLAGVV
jgi:MFS family permease